ncbi:MAG TPA: DNA gyrase inhibitor YacG [Burkholderiales bacterium]|nr:DNA gyrase inhibitor YacG [Burkholderiales bacterium]
MSQSKPNLRSVSCPQCGTPTTWQQSNPYRPFCSERCKLIDLGQWASESYRIPQAEEEHAKSGQDQTGSG